MPPEKHMLITAGPTHERLDAVRYLANRSSGKLGVALAEAALCGDWRVTLLLGPCAAAAPAGATTHRFESAAELQSLLDEHFPRCDVLIMAAAVADYRPLRPEAGKLPRTDAGLTIDLEPVPDLVARCAVTKRDDQLIIGFALEEPDHLDTRAAAKLKRKSLDAIVANPLDTMAADTIDAALITGDGDAIRPGAMSKHAFANWLIDWIAHRPC